MRKISIISFLIFLVSISSFAGQPSGTFPVIHIQTANSAAINSRETYMNATYWISGTEANPSYTIGSEATPIAMQIRGRGNWTWTGFDKKPYKIKLAAKTSLLGLKADKHFALLAHADDNKGFLRNTLGFWLSEQIGLAWTPKQQPIEVILNGEYIGLYFLTETIRVEKNRVNIVEQADNTTNSDSITGGWLVEIDNYDKDPHITITEGDGYPIWFTYKTPEILSSAQESFLTREMSRINALVYGDKTSEELWKHVDIDALAKFYIVQEITDNYESFHGSCYLYRDMGADKKWHFGPVWDFGSAFNYKKTQYCYQGREHHQTWIGEICKFPTFQKRVKEIWNDFIDNYYQDIYSYIDDFSNTLTTAAQADAQRWPQYGNKDMENRIRNIKNLLAGTKTWLCQQWGYGNSQDERLQWIVWFDDNGIPAWENVHCFVWDDHAEGYSGCYQPLGDWPGTPMQTTEYNGKTYYSISFRTDYPLSSSAGIIFNNSKSKAGNQTADLILENNSIYNREGKTGDIPAPSSVQNVHEDETTTYYTLQGIPTDNPQSGQVYIVRKGSHVEKQFIR